MPIFEAKWEASFESPTAPEVQDEGGTEGDRAKSIPHGLLKGEAAAAGHGGAGAGDTQGQENEEKTGADGEWGGGGGAGPVFALRRV